MIQTSWTRPEMNSVMPYFHVKGTAQFIDFLKLAFGAKEVFRAPREDGTIQHAEILIGDSVVEAADTTEYPPMPTAIHLYVPDADAVYQKAIAAGATSMMEPADMDYGDREGDVKDPFGNQWYIATHKSGNSYAPDRLRTITPCLRVAGAAKLIDFMKKAFDAEELMRVNAPDGTLIHAKILVSDSVIEPGEARPELPAMLSAIHVYLPDTDAAYRRAIEAGATSLIAPGDTNYGDRAAAVTDPFGNFWYLATYTGKTIS